MNALIGRSWDTTAFAVAPASEGLRNEPGHPIIGYSIPTDVVCLMVLWRFCYKLSLRDLAEMFLQRSLSFPHEAVRDCEAKLAPWLLEALRKRRHRAVRESRYEDET